jgi:hypothetical protein
MKIMNYLSMINVLSNECPNIDPIKNSEIFHHFQEIKTILIKTIYDEAPEVSHEEKELVKKGERIEAIKNYRKRHNIDLQTASKKIDEYILNN